jgi:methyl-accepting chemotaxis protein
MSLKKGFFHRICETFSIRFLMLRKRIGRLRMIAQVNRGIGQLSTVVQTNSATAEEAAAASEELASQADLLKSMVEKFTLKANGLNMRVEEHKPLPKPKVNSPKIQLTDDNYGKY